MIKTKAGTPVIIVGGSKKSITGRKPFEVEVAGPESYPELIRILTPSRRFANLSRMKLTRTELVFDSEDELYEALGLTR